MYQLSTNFLEYPRAWLCRQHICFTSSNDVIGTSAGHVYSKTFLKPYWHCEIRCDQLIHLRLVCETKINTRTKSTQEQSFGPDSVSGCRFRPKLAEKIYSSLPTGEVQFISSLVINLFTSLLDKTRETFSVTKLRKKKRFFLFNWITLIWLGHVIRYVSTIVGIETRSGWTVGTRFSVSIQTGPRPSQPL